MLPSRRVGTYKRKTLTSNLSHLFLRPTPLSFLNQLKIRAQLDAPYITHRTKVKMEIYHTAVSFIPDNIERSRDILYKTCDTSYHQHIRHEHRKRRTVRTEVKGLGLAALIVSLPGSRRQLGKGLEAVRLHGRLPMLEVSNEREAKRHRISKMSAHPFS
jgi:hypothetical protein